MYPTVIPVGDEASSGEAKKEESLLKYSLPSSRISSQINVSLCGALQWCYGMSKPDTLGQLDHMLLYHHRPMLAASIQYLPEILKVGLLSAVAIYTSWNIVFRDNGWI